jgi:hypothetical protein
MNYTMKFLKKPVLVTIVHPITLKKTKYSFCAKEMHSNDVKALNELFETFQSNLKITGSTNFFNGKRAIICDSSYPSQVCEYEEDIKWNVKLQIQGYKTSSGGQSTPIWSLYEAKKL